MGYNKIIYGGETLIDLTGDSVTEGTLLKGQTAHDKSGEVITGTCTFDADTTDATVTVSEILNKQTAYARGAKLIGTMPNNGAVDIILDLPINATIPVGYHDGSGVARISDENVEKLKPENIKEGVDILGVTGSLKPSSSVTATSKTVTPTNADQTILPPTGTDYLSQVVVKAIPYVETTNSAGGTTVTIG